jgi:hypothetical protein
MEALRHIIIDADGFYNGLIMPKLHANYLYYTSHMSLVIGLYGLYKKNMMAIYPLIIFIASINYWRHPIDNWRRYLDIACCVLCLLFQTVQSINHPHFMSYISVMGLGVLCYPISFYFQHIYLPLSTLSHSLIHIVGNIANYILYTNDVCDISINENEIILSQDI